MSYLDLMIYTQKINVSGRITVSIFLIKECNRHETGTEKDQSNPPHMVQREHHRVDFLRSVHVSMIVNILSAVNYVALV
jgi:hypothetical protein